ncbi:serine hydrolase [Mucilaginibacter sp. SG564]|uniref:serine hydrolase domain-containing protein n=1 Tax=Mucilaginibacter sp. SG564 TaxID=2587022 RepID=UPI0015556888|nr:serine hydrolase [Mucilaginibacter sp. SG564]NOW99003.1 hypothetical protein [Mucilaginibacter sp. SG564]
MATEKNRANINNWKTRPFNRWSFHHVKKFIPSIAIANDIQHQNLLENAPVSIKGFILKQLLKATATDAVVILHKGKIVYEAYANGNDEHTPHILMSATKAVVGLVAGILEHQGAIDLSAPVSAYIPQIIGTIYQQVTLRQLLDMRAGIVLDEDQQKQYDIATNWEPVPEGNEPLGLHDFFTRLKSSGKLTDQNFSYVSANTDLLGWALECATGRSFNTLLSDLIWKPMGAENEAYITVDKYGAPRCTGGLCVTARDFARVGQLIINEGMHNSTEIIPPSLINDITSNGDGDAWANGQWGKAFAPISKNMSYRNGWYMINDEPQIMFAMGIYGQNLFIDRANDMVIAKFSSWKEPTDYVALPLTHQLVKTVRSSLRV